MKKAKLFYKRFFYSFPVQLLMMHIKKNQILLLYWVVLFGFITGTFAMKYGIPYLFLDPEYTGVVGFRSFFIMGLTCGIFIMAFNISSYILNSFRFPFLATLYHTFQKYAYNNFIIPSLFVLVYVMNIIRFQAQNQFQSNFQLFTDVAAFTIGLSVIIYVTLKYFQYTNKDVYHLFGIKTDDHYESKSVRTVSPIRESSAKKSTRRTWRVDTYITFPMKIKLVRRTSHYKPFMIQTVFRQNHINAAVLEIIIFVAFILLGLFRDHAIFRIPAGASIFLLFTMIIMLSGVLRFWLRAWANTVIVVIFLVINFFSQFEVFNPKNKAYGLDYTVSPAEYSIPSIENQLSKENFDKDVESTTAVLENWKDKWIKKGVAKPKMVVVFVSGGGVRSALFTFHTLQIIDSLMQGDLFDQMSFISGSSGGIIGAAYYRELFLRGQSGPQSKDFYKAQNCLDNIGKDMLNATTFSFTISDLFLNIQKFREGNNTYIKDRAYAFEQQLNENTGNILDKRIRDYSLPEKDAKIPMMVVAPTILTDGRMLLIAPLNHSYLLQSQLNAPFDHNITPDGIELSRFFKNQNAGNLKFTSALRMNATFPYIMPAASLPSTPPIEVMDAGIRDNYGADLALKFIFTFKDWIKDNTSGIILVQIRDNGKKPPVEPYSIKTIIERFTAPFKNVSGNFLVMQDYKHDSEYEYANSCLGGKIEFVNFELPQQKEKISLSWHLTEKEKNYVINEVNNWHNKKSLFLLKHYLEKTYPPEPAKKQSSHAEPE